MTTKKKATAGGDATGSGQATLEVTSASDPTAAAGTRQLASSVVPFGKYKGQPIEVLRQDQNYLEWLSQQEWFREKFAHLYTLLVKEPEDTPEHNRYQALFLDEEFAGRVYNSVLGPTTLSISVTFEVCLRFRDGPHHIKQSGAADVHIKTSFCLDKPVRVEIKPAMGDDYPAVLRQMKTACCNALYLVRYTGTGATLEQVRKMFAASGITVLMRADFETF